nr:hypothetical protein BaRGS_027758 [Batillaria attramentaria]
MGWKRDPSRLDRMPSFGKRTSGLADGVDRDFTADIGSERHEKRVAVLDRMPGTFGKRGGDSGSAENEDIGFEDGGAHSGVSGSLGKSSHEAGSVRGREEPSGIAEDKRAPGVLNRMPVTFGKRGLAAVLSDMKNEAEKFGEYQEKRLAKLDRMPLTFGKRDNAKDSRIDLGVGDVWEKRLAKLDRMPLTFGKRGGEVDEERDGEDLGDFAADKRQAKLDRMPLNFGKRGDLVDLGKTEESSGSAGGQHLAKLTRTAFVDAAKTLGIRVDGWEKRRAKLDRMPLTFGKRGVSGGRAKLLQSDDSGGIKRLAKLDHVARLDRLPVTFVKRFSGGERILTESGRSESLPESFQSHNILAARTVFRPVQTQEDSQEYLHVDTLLARHLPALLRR